jgi:hypothetical protein
MQKQHCTSITRTDKHTHPHTRVLTLQAANQIKHHPSPISLIKIKFLSEPGVPSTQHQLYNPDSKPAPIPFYILLMLMLIETHRTLQNSSEHREAPNTTNISKQQQ